MIKVSTGMQMDKFALLEKSITLSSTQEDLSQHDWNIVDWNGKNQSKHTHNVIYMR